MLFPKPAKRPKKQRREVDVEYMKWICEQACCVPNCGRYPSQAHHAVHKSHLGSDKTCVPLCFNCHSLYHMKYGSVEAFEEAFKINLIEESKKIYQRFEKSNSSR